MAYWQEIQTCNNFVPFMLGKSTKVGKLCIRRVQSGPNPLNIALPGSFVAWENKYLRLWDHLLTRLVYNKWLLKPIFQELWSVISQVQHTDWFNVFFFPAKTFCN